MSIDAMKQALEALELLERYDNQRSMLTDEAIEGTWEIADAAMDTLRTAIEQAEKQEPVAWKNAAIRLGEELSSVGPDGYYDMTAEQWLNWAMDQQPCGKNSLAAPPQRQPHELLCVCGASWSIDSEGNEELLSTPPQRQPLTEEEIEDLYFDGFSISKLKEFARAIERAHGIGGGE